MATETQVEHSDARSTVLIVTGVRIRVAQKVARFYRHLSDRLNPTDSFCVCKTNFLRQERAGGQAECLSRILAIFNAAEPSNSNWCRDTWRDSISFICLFWIWETLTISFFALHRALLLISLEILRTHRTLKRAWINFVVLLLLEWFEIETYLCR